MVEFELLLGDYQALSNHVSAPGPNERRLWIGATFIASFICIAFFRRDGGVFLAGMAVGYLLIVARVLRTQRRLQPRPGGGVLCHYHVQLSHEGVHVKTPNWTLDVPWHGVVAVEETAAHCFVRMDTVSVHTIPKRSFPDGEALRQFVDFARECASRARGSARQS